jgi:nucleoside-diphosphate-sugar epimerase
MVPRIVPRGAVRRSAQPYIHVVNQQRIAVLGAGYVGGAFASASVLAGHEVWAVRRSTVERGDARVRWLRGDIATGDVEGLPSDLDAIVLTVSPAGGRQAYDTVYPPAAHGALMLASRTGAPRVLYTSSTGVYGGRDGAWVTEQSQRSGVGAGNAALIAAEDILLNDGADVCVMRVAGIYGPGRDPRARMRDAAALPQRGEYWSNLAHRDDIVSALLHALTGATVPRIMNVSDGNPARAADICRWIVAAEGGDPDAIAFPNEEQRSRNDQRVSNAALLASGWNPLYPSFREGFQSGL